MPLDKVDAVLGALIGFLALEGTYTTVMDQYEGVILLPVKDLSRTPLKRSQPSGDNGPSRAKPGRAPSPSKSECGCGAPVTSRFPPAHDATLKSRLKRAHAAGGEEATEHLRKLGWLD